MKKSSPDVAYVRREGGYSKAMARQRLMLTIACAGFLLLTLLALLQPASPREVHRRSWMEPARWMAPLELNSSGHLAWINGSINAITSVPGSSHVWAVGDGGLILHSSDYGDTWERQNAAAAQTTASIRPYIYGMAWADGGPPKSKSYDPKTSYTTLPQQQAVQQQSPTTKPATRKPVTPRTPPSTIPSTPPTPPAWLIGSKTDDLIAVHFSTPQRGWAAGRYGTMLATADGGRTWSFDSSIGGSPMRWRRFEWFRFTGRPAPDWAEYEWRTSDKDTPWEIRSAGGIYRSAEPLLPCIKRGQIPAARAAWCTTDSRTVWIGGTGGALGKITDYSTFSARNSGVTSTIRALCFEGNRGWAAGEEGVILRTEDAGETWQRITRPPGSTERPARLPAPWYYALTFPLVGLLVWRATRPLPPVETIEQVEDSVVRDTPLDATSPDVMNFGRIARGLSRFLRNENTLPPLTISIDGEWGSGKSSLMNLLREDLVRYGFRPVWFNAWHHQQEEHLLAALLQCIRGQATPPWWRPDNWLFRFRLLRIRCSRNWIPLLLLLGVFSGLLTVVLRGSADRAAIVDIAHHVTALDFEGALRSFLPSAPALAFLITAISGIVTFWRGLTAFGVNPAKLLASVSATARLGDLQAQTSFREKFQSEFRDVTAALGPRSLLILIDDLDRCKPESIMTVLESVNFLISSGGCFVVIGMARHIVERAVGLHFAAIANEMAQDGLQDPTSEQKRERRRDFARQYLDKLINIEVPLPQPTVEQARRLLVRGRSEMASPRPGFLQTALSSAWRWLLPAALACLSIMIGIRLGSVLNVPHHTDPATVTTSAAQQKPITEGQSQTTSTPSAPATSLQAQDIVNGPAADVSLTARERTDLIWLLLLIGSGLLLAVVWWKIQEPPGLILKDSQEFEEALRIWIPVVAAYRNTPRALKRFLNRVRYMAMFQMPEEPGAASETHRIRESTIVALGALHFACALPTDASRVALLPEIVQIRLSEAVSEHQMAGYVWPPAPEDLEGFESILPQWKPGDSRPSAAGGR